MVSGGLKQFYAAVPAKDLFSPELSSKVPIDKGLKRLEEASRAVKYCK